MRESIYLWLETQDNTELTEEQVKQLTDAIEQFEFVSFCTLQDCTKVDNMFDETEGDL